MAQEKQMYLFDKSELSKLEKLGHKVQEIFVDGKTFLSVKAKAATSLTLGDTAKSLYKNRYARLTGVAILSVITYEGLTYLLSEVL